MKLVYFFNFHLHQAHALCQFAPSNDEIPMLIKHHERIWTLSDFLLNVVYIKEHIYWSTLRSTASTEMHSLRFSTFTFNLPTLHSNYQLYNQLPNLHSTYQIYIQLTDFTFSLSTLHSIYQLYIQLQNLHSTYQIYIKFTNFTFNLSTLHLT